MKPPQLSEGADRIAAGIAEDGRLLRYYWDRLALGYSGAMAALGAAYIHSLETGRSLNYGRERLAHLLIRVPGGPSVH